MSSTFGSLTTVKLGIYAAQKGLDVTGNNITNINTNGYTRQRLDQVSLISGGSDRYHSQYNVRVGQGVLVNGVSQLRDPGLDLLPEVPGRCGLGGFMARRPGEAGRNPGRGGQGRRRAG